MQPTQPTLIFPFSVEGTQYGAGARMPTPEDIGGNYRLNLIITHMQLGPGEKFISHSLLRIGRQDTSYFGVVIPEKDPAGLPNIIYGPLIPLSTNPRLLTGTPPFLDILEGHMNERGVFETGTRRLNDSLEELALVSPVITSFQASYDEARSSVTAPFFSLGYALVLERGKGSFVLTGGQDDFYEYWKFLNASQRSGTLLRIRPVLVEYEQSPDE